MSPPPSCLSLYEYVLRRLEDVLKANGVQLNAVCTARLLKHLLVGLFEEGINFSLFSPKQSIVVW